MQCNEEEKAGKKKRNELMGWGGRDAVVGID
jgi:hypothetical protein